MRLFQHHCWTLLLQVLAILLAMSVADETSGDTTTVVEHFYLHDAGPVMEYINDDVESGGIQQNLFMNQAGPRVVEFYSPQCPACNEFRPHYIKLAEATVERFPSVRFYGVSCDKYEQLCDQYGVEDFPTIKVFPIDDTDPSSIGQLLPSNTKLSPKRLAAQLKVLQQVPRIIQEDEDPEDEDPEDEDETEDENESVDNQDEDEDENAVERVNSQEDEDENESPDNQDDEDEDEKGTGAPQMENLPVEDEETDTETSHPQADEIAETENPEDEATQDPEDEATEDPEDEEEALPDLRDPQSNMMIPNQQIPLSMNGRRPNAGHMMAKTGDKQMDRYRSIQMDEKQQYLSKRKGLGGSFRKDSAKDKYGKPLPPTTMEETTTSMRKFTPGTLEFQERQRAYAERMKSKKMKRHGQIQAEPLILKKEALPFTKDVRKPSLAKKAAEHIPIIKRMVKMTEEEELILDASLSLTVALETGVSMGIESLESRTAMRKWLDLLAVSLPPEWAIHKMIDGIRNRFMYATKSKENFRELVRAHALPRKGWSKSCSSKNTPTGFSCGMWKLLHIITVGVVEERGGQNLIESGMVAPNSKTFSPMEAADTIRNFLSHFFTCRPCRENFIENYDQCENNRRCDRLAFNDDLEAIAPSDWKELPLWLWEVHNEVSVRLVHERAKRDYDRKGVRKFVTPKDEVKVIWPNVETCILCFNEDGTWNEGQVFRHLEKVYWPGSEVDPKHDKLLTFDDESRSFGFLWIVTLLIVWVVYNTIGKQSRSIQSSVLVAKQLVAQGTAGVSMGMGGKKARTA